MYIIIDRKTGLQVGKAYASLSRCSARIDKLDNAYGGYRYFHKRVEVQS